MPTIKVKNLKTGEWEKLPTVKGEDGKDYVLTDKDKTDIANLTKASIQPTLDEIQEVSERAETIAKGRATGYVFDTLNDLEVWLQNTENTSKLVLGDNLYIRAVGVPDYWWDGTTKQVLETQKVDLTEYVKNTEYEEWTFELEDGTTITKKVVVV